MTENKRFTCEVVDTGLFRIERITDTLENNTFSDVKTATNLLNNFNEEVEQLKAELEFWKSTRMTKKKELPEKRCSDCKHTKGIGYDFWCGEGHTEYEVFGAETNCPYFEYHDWSKGTPSEIEKKELPEICANISLKRMFLILLKTQEMVLENNPQYKKKEILNLLTSIEHDILLLNDNDNRIDRDLFE